MSLNEAIDTVRIFVDADACPVRIRDLIARAAIRRDVQTFVVANKPIALLQSPCLSSVVVPADPDAADKYIEENARAGDLVITQDIPLAALLVPKGVFVIAPRGMQFTLDNIADLLSRRDLMTELRDAGKISTSTPPLDEKAIRKFASTFDAVLHQLVHRTMK
jgi:uncharacterized protein YaiI (UPF0178 family)